LVAVIKGFLFVAILTISSVVGLFRGIWGESDRLTRLWLVQLGTERHRGSLSIPVSLEGSLYWVIRIFAFVLQIACLIFVFGWLGNVIRRAVGF
jgi:hypothetical protein